MKEVAQKHGEATNPQRAQQPPSQGALAQGAQAQGALSVGALPLDGANASPPPAGAIQRAQPKAGLLNSANVIYLQRAVGNHEVARILGRQGGRATYRAASQSLPAPGGLNPASTPDNAQPSVQRQATPPQKHANKGTDANPAKAFTQRQRSQSKSISGVIQRQIFRGDTPVFPFLPDQLEVAEYLTGILGFKPPIDLVESVTELAKDDLPHQESDLPMLLYHEWFRLEDTERRGKTRNWTEMMVRSTSPRKGTKVAIKWPDLPRISPNMKKDKLPPELIGQMGKIAEQLQEELKLIDEPPSLILTILITEVLPALNSTHQSMTAFEMGEKLSAILLELKRIAVKIQFPGYDNTEHKPTARNVKRSSELQPTKLENWIKKPVVTKGKTGTQSFRQLMKTLALDLEDRKQQLSKQQLPKSTLDPLVMSISTTSLSLPPMITPSILSTSMTTESPPKKLEPKKERKKELPTKEPQKKEQTEKRITKEESTSEGTLPPSNVNMEKLLLPPTEALKIVKEMPKEDTTPQSGSLSKETPLPILEPIEPINRPRESKTGVTPSMETEVLETELIDKGLVKEEIPQLLETVKPLLPKKPEPKPKEPRSNTSRSRKQTDGPKIVESPKPKGVGKESTLPLMTDTLPAFFGFLAHNASADPPQGMGSVQEKEQDSPLYYFRSQSKGAHVHKSFYLDLLTTFLTKSKFGEHRGNLVALNDTLQQLIKFVISEDSPLLKNTSYEIESIPGVTVPIFKRKKEDDKDFAGEFAGYSGLRRTNPILYTQALRAILGHEELTDEEKLDALINFIKYNYFGNFKESEENFKRLDPRVKQMEEPNKEIDELLYNIEKSVGLPKGEKKSGPKIESKSESKSESKGITKEGIEETSGFGPSLGGQSGSLLEKNIAYRGAFAAKLAKLLAGAHFKHLIVFNVQGNPNLIIQPISPQTPENVEYSDGWVNSIIATLGGLLNHYAAERDMPIYTDRRQSFGFLRPSLTDTGKSLRLSLGQQPPAFGEIIIRALYALDAGITACGTELEIGNRPFGPGAKQTHLTRFLSSESNQLAAYKEAEKFGALGAGALSVVIAWVALQDVVTHPDKPVPVKPPEQSTTLSLGGMETDKGLSLEIPSLSDSDGSDKEQQPKKPEKPERPLPRKQQPKTTLPSLSSTNSPTSVIKSMEQSLESSEVGKETIVKPEPKKEKERKVLLPIKSTNRNESVTKTDTPFLDIGTSGDIEKSEKSTKPAPKKSSQPLKIEPKPKPVKLLKPRRLENDYDGYLKDAKLRAIKIIAPAFEQSGEFDAMVKETIPNFEKVSVDLKKANMVQSTLRSVLQLVHATLSEKRAPQYLHVTKWIITRLISQSQKGLYLLSQWPLLEDDPAVEAQLFAKAVLVIEALVENLIIYRSAAPKITAKESMKSEEGTGKSKNLEEKIQEELIRRFESFGASAEFIRVYRAESGEQAGVAALIAAAAEAKRSRGGVMNIGSDEPYFEFTKLLNNSKISDEQGTPVAKIVDIHPGISESKSSGLLLEEQNLLTKGLLEAPPKLDKPYTLIVDITNSNINSPKVGRGIELWLTMRKSNPLLRLVLVTSLVKHEQLGVDKFQAGRIFVFGPDLPDLHAIDEQARHPVLDDFLEMMHTLD